MSSLAWIYLYSGLALILILCADILRRYYNFRYQLNQKSIILELTPPAFTHKTPLATEQLFAVLHVIGRSRSWRESLLGRTSSFSFEVVSTRSEGIRYLVRLAEEDVPVFQKQLAAYLPDVHFKQVDDYLETALASNPSMRLMEYKQARHFAYPLASHDSLAQHDPVAYITGSMTKLAPDELIAFQMVLSSISPREVHRLRNKLAVGKDPNLYGKEKHVLTRLLRFFFTLPIRLLWFISDATAPAPRSGQKSYAQPQQSYMQSPANMELVSAIQSKLGQQLFQVSIRSLVVSDDAARSQQSTMGMSAALAAFAVPGYQGLIAKRSFPNRLRFPYRLYSFQHRLPAPIMKHATVLAISEVASLYHFPYGDTARPENLSASHSRTLSAPAALKRLSDSDGFDVVLGINKHHGSDTPIGLTAAERERHSYIIGGTGNGKTTMLQYAIVQDMQNGKGVAVVDPHGDLAETILEHVPEDRLNDVIYFNPSDIDYPIGLNLLELPKGLSGNQLALEQDFVTEAIVSLFRKTFSEDDSGGHRIEYILRNTIRTAYTVPDATLFTLYDLLTDTNYRNGITQKLTDKRLKQFWHNEFAKAGNMQRVKMTSGVTTKLGRYDSSAVARGVIEQVNSTIDFDDILNSGKILICNFAKGSIGEDTAELFGTAVLTKLQLAALRRVRTKQSERRPFYLYVDEFQHFATHSFLQMLSEARKYKLFLTMAEQSTAQQEEQRLVHIILDNVGTVVCFRVRAASEKLLLPIFQPSIQTGEIASLPAFSYYIKIAGMETREPLSGETVLLAEPTDTKIANKVIAASRRQYATKTVASGQKKQQSETTEPEEENNDSGVAFEQEQQPVL